MLSRMRAYELHPADDFAALTLVDRKSSELGPRDVRVRVRAASLNYRDLAILRNAKIRGRQPSLVPVSDGAGEVIAVGAAVTRFRGGERVAGAFFPAWIDGELSAAVHASALGGAVDGMLAEEVVLDERAWVPVPAHLSYDEAATLPCAGVTAYHALFEAAQVGPGQTVLVQGTGGVSVYALQLAKAAGARVIVTSKSAEKRARASSMGADFTIDYVAAPEWGRVALEWTGQRGVDVVVEVGGPGTFDQSVAALRYGGTMSILGVLTGGRGEVNTYNVFHKGLRVHGVYVGSVRMFEALNRAVEARAIHPVVDKVFAFDEARAAYEYLASGAHFGKVVIRVGS